MNQPIFNDLKKELAIDCPKEETRITDFIQHSIKELHRDGAVIGLSGGLDSTLCAYLLEKALGKGKVLAVLLPERDSAPINHQHAHLVADTLGLKTIEHDLTKSLQEIGVYDIGKKQLKSEKAIDNYIKNATIATKLYGGYLYHDMMGAYYGEETSMKWKLVGKIFKKATNEAFAFEMTKPRLRMVYLYFYANLYNYSVIGTTDKSEFSTGLFCNYGDGANDIQILLHLYKTQIEQLARYMNLPLAIIEKPHTGDLYGNLPHTVALGMNYKELDMLLLAMDKGYTDEQLTEIVPGKGVDSIKQLTKVAGLIKKLPLSIESL